MYKVTVFETAAELLDAFNKTQDGADTLAPVLSVDVQILFDGDHYVGLTGDGSERFAVDEKIKQSDVIEELVSRAGARVYIT